MKYLTIFALLVIGTVHAAPSKTKFKCTAAEADKKIEISLEFTILSIEDKDNVEAALGHKAQDDYDHQSPIKFQYRKAGSNKWITPKQPYYHMRAAALNGGDSGEFYLGKSASGEEILVKGASDTCVGVDFTLYKNSGYKNGYISSKNHCDPEGKDASYSKVVCSVKKVK